MGEELFRQRNGTSPSLEEETCLAPWRKAGAETGEEGGDVDRKGRRAATWVTPLKS